MVSVVWVAYSCITRQRRDTKYLGRDVLPQYPELAHVQTISLCLGPGVGVCTGGEGGRVGFIENIACRYRLTRGGVSLAAQRGPPPIS